MYDYTFKTILDKNETLGKFNKGARKFEIQLLDNFMEKGFNLKKAFDEFDKKEVDVISVHSPISWNLDNGTIYLEHLTSDYYKELFFKVCEFAQLFADYYKHPVNVIIHNSFRFENYMLIPSLLEGIIEIINLVSEQYPDIIVEIENTTPMSIDYSINPYFCSGVLFENVEIVKYLNKNCKKAICKTVIDVCHYLTSIRVIKLTTYRKFSLEDLFITHHGIVGTIHLANVKDLGVRNGEHGCGFEKTKEDINLLKEVLSYIDKYAKDADICLEISEKDYYNTPDLFKTVELIEKIKSGKI